ILVRFLDLNCRTAIAAQLALAGQIDFSGIAGVGACASIAAAGAARQR
ncbi:MAG: hypothetical protein QOE78_1639, partial [Alphaproteobacteria bacterium]|nr:hypothetical protein [Alphaproteobacteria bacterium]